MILPARSSDHKLFGFDWLMSPNKDETGLSLPKLVVWWSNWHDQPFIKNDTFKISKFCHSSSCIDCSSHIRKILNIIFQKIRKYNLPGKYTTIINLRRYISALFMSNFIIIQISYNLGNHNKFYISLNLNYSVIV